MSVYRKYQPRGPTPATVATVATNVASEPGNVATLAIVAAPNPVPDDFEERAAVVCIDSGLPVEWAEPFAQLLGIPSPEGMAAHEWADLHNAAGVLLDRWAGQLTAMGWTPRDVLGVESNNTGWQSQCLLSVLARGVRVGAVSRHIATIVFTDGSTRQIVKKSEGWFYE